jgi:hypothetical protein
MPDVSRAGDALLALMAMLSRLRILLVLGTLTLSLAAEIVADISLHNPVHGWRLAQLLFAAALFVASGGSFLYVAAVLDECRDGAKDPSTLKMNIAARGYALLQWGGVYSVPFLVCGIVLLVD